MVWPVSRSIMSWKTINKKQKKVSVLLLDISSFMWSQNWKKNNHGYQKKLVSSILLNQYANYFNDNVKISIRSKLLLFKHNYVHQQYPISSQPQHLVPLPILQCDQPHRLPSSCFWQQRHNKRDSFWPLPLPRGSEQQFVPRLRYHCHSYRPPKHLLSKPKNSNHMVRRLYGKVFKPIIFRYNGSVARCAVIEYV